MDAPTAPPDIAVRVLGPAAILADGRPVPLQGKRTRGLLAALVLHAGRVVPAAELIALIWGGDAPKTAANQLQIAVHRLRAALSAVDLGGRLGTRDGGYALDLPEGARVDLHDFRELAAAAAARAAAGDWTAA
ncbi:MAG TPA: helix-turn-helix domain-containing protein, partial [Phytomonospora sp.]